MIIKPHQYGQYAAQIRNIKKAGQFANDIYNGISHRTGSIYGKFGVILPNPNIKELIDDLNNYRELYGRFPNYEPTLIK